MSEKYVPKKYVPRDGDFALCSAQGIGAVAVIASGPTQSRVRLDHDLSVRLVGNSWLSPFLPDAVDQRVRHVDGGVGVVVRTDGAVVAMRYSAPLPGGPAGITDSRWRFVRVGLARDPKDVDRDTSSSFSPGDLVAWHGGDAVWRIDSITDVANISRRTNESSRGSICRVANLNELTPLRPTAAGQRVRLGSVFGRTFDPYGAAGGPAYQVHYEDGGVSGYCAKDLVRVDEPIKTRASTPEPQPDCRPEYVPQIGDMVMYDRTQHEVVARYAIEGVAIESFVSVREVGAPWRFKTVSSSDLSPCYADGADQRVRTLSHDLDTNGLVGITAPPRFDSRYCFDVVFIGIGAGPTGENGGTWRHEYLIRVADTVPVSPPPRRRTVAEIPAQADAAVAPVPPRIHFQLSQLHCAVHGTLLRMPDETRVHWWLCGCEVKPEGEWAQGSIHDSNGKTAQLRGYQMWGYGAVAEGFTRDDALSAWRQRLAFVQQNGWTDDVQALRASFEERRRSKRYGGSA